jgi:sulfatase modifying factor 1
MKTRWHCLWLLAFVWGCGIPATRGAEAGQNNVPVGMALIPAGPFTMGDSVDGESNATPAVTVMVSAFYMDTNLVTFAQWQQIYAWGISHGYAFDHAGFGKGTNHPVQTVSWYDAVKWCNARSQFCGFGPVYYTDATLTQVYTNDDLKTVHVSGTATGYRLPTEAEWEKGARGGLKAQRFPWGTTISRKQANYYSKTSYSYDRGPSGYNPAFTNGKKPYTSRVGHFPANGYGLYDMAGNVSKWCWDWYGVPYAGGIDPSGPLTGSDRVARGGDWDFFANHATCASRFYYYPTFALGTVGFRCVKNSQNGNSP